MGFFMCFFFFLVGGRGMITPYAYTSHLTLESLTWFPASLLKVVMLHYITKAETKVSFLRYLLTFILVTSIIMFFLLCRDWKWFMNLILYWIQIWLRSWRKRSVKAMQGKKQAVAKPFFGLPGKHISVFDV